MRNRLDAHPEPSGPRLQPFRPVLQNARSLQVVPEEFCQSESPAAAPRSSAPPAPRWSDSTEQPGRIGCLILLYSVFCLLYSYLQQLCVEIIAGAAVAAVVSFPDCAKKFSAARFL